MSTREALIPGIGFVNETVARQALIPGAGFINEAPLVDATTYTLTGPSTGTVGTATSNFTVQASGHLSSSVTVTPNDSSHLGTFSPTSVTLASGTNTSATFTYTPLYYGGPFNIATTNSSTLTDPSAIAFTSSLPAGGSGAIFSRVILGM